MILRLRPCSVVAFSLRIILYLLAPDTAFASSEVGPLLKNEHEPESVLQKVLFSADISCSRPLNSSLCGRFCHAAHQASLAGVYPMGP